MVVVDILWWIDDHGMANLELNYEILAVSRILRKHRQLHQGNNHHKA